MTFSLTNPIILIALSALGYALATLAMKHMADTPSTITLCIIIGFFALAIAFEILVLKSQRLAFSYIAILGLEALIIISISFMIGESLTLRETMGGLMVLGGAAIMWF